MGSRTVERTVDAALREGGAPLTIVDCALALDEAHSTNHRVELRQEQFEEFARRCSIYNRMERDTFLAFAEAIRAHAPTMQYGTLNGAPNPNNGHPFHTIDVGNEGSRVVYVRMLRVYLKGRDDEALAAMSAFKLAAGLASADEIHDVSDEHEYVLRVWWD